MRRCLTPNSNVLITGVTGLIGGEIFRRLDARDHRGVVWTLVRPTADQDPGQRLRDRLARSGGDDLPRCEVCPVAGDILCPDWGLSGDDKDVITRDVDIIIHNAADTSFAAHRDTTRTNVEGVRRLIALAQQCRRQPLVVYMSTASNVGQVTRTCVQEDEGCRPDHDHFNEYTQSKAIAERLLRQSGLPVLTLRPTIVLSAGLPDPVFARQILWCCPLTRIFAGLPIDPAARLDIVDVGFVAEATLRLLEAQQRPDDCYHLSAGLARSVTVGELGNLVGEANGRKSTLRLIPPGEWTRSDYRKYVDTELRRRVFRSLRHYFPFLNMDVVYDNSRLKQVVPDSSLRVEAPEAYLGTLLGLIRPKAALREACLP